MNKKTKFFLTDFSASIVVFLVALPLCLGIALGSQAPLFSGIISGVIGGIVIGVLSGSALSVSGPAAGLIAIVILSLQKLGSFEAFLLAGLIAGGIQIIFGFLRFGSLGDFVPNSVIKGMLAAIGIILIIKQLPHFFGYENAPEIDEDSMQVADHAISFFNLTKIFDDISVVATMIGAVSVVILIIFELSFFKKNKFFKFVPAPLVAVVTGALINEYFLSTNPDIALKQGRLVYLSSLSNISDIKANLIFPDFTKVYNPDIWFIALTIAIVASIETLLCVEATDKLDQLRRRTSGNRELKAQGVGNLISGFVGGLPITSVIVRSSANVNAGAQSKLSTILHGAWLVLAIFFIPNLLNKIPYSALAAILIVTGFKLAKPSIFKDLYKLGFDQLIPFAITIVAILFTNLLMGIFVGIAISIIFILYSNFNSSVMVVQKDNNCLVRFRKDVSFLNKAMLKKTLDQFPRRSYILIDVSKSDFIDKDVIEVINDFRKNAALKKIRVEIKKNDFNNLHKLIK